MMKNSEAGPLDPNALLAHAGWVRALAARLVLDPAHVDDVVQEVWHAALRRPAEPRVSHRAWLSGVVRNIALMGRRTELRRRRREKLAARPDEAPSTAELAERAELQGKLVSRVGDLPEEAREVVLLRFFEDLPPRKIARRLAIPVNTVRSRLSRALARLREDLDADHGDRQKWGLLFLPLIRPVDAARAGAASSLLATTLVLVTQPLAKIGIAAGLVVALAGTTWWLTGPEPIEDLRRYGPVVDALEGLEDATPEPEPSPETATREPAPMGTDAIRGRVVDPQGRPVSGARVHPWVNWVFEARVRSGRIARAVWEVDTEADGGFELPLLEGSKYVLGEAKHDDYVAEREWSTWEKGETPLLVMRRRYPAELEVEVLDKNTGRPVPRFEVRVIETWHKVEGVTVVGGPTRHQLMTLRTDGWNGRLARREIRLVEGVKTRVWVNAWGYGPGEWGETDRTLQERTIGPADGRLIKLRFELDMNAAERLAASRVVRGRVVDHEGETPIPGAVLSMARRSSSKKCRSVVSSDDGHFVIALPKDGSAGELTAEHPDYETAVTRDLDPAEVVLRLERRGSLICTVVDSMGAPMAGAPFLFRTMDGKVIERGETDQQGRLEFQRLLAARYHVFVLPHPRAADEQALAHASYRVRPRVELDETLRVDPPDRVVVTGTISSAGPLRHRLLPIFVPLNGDGGWVRARPEGRSCYAAGGLSRGTYLVALVPPDDGVRDAPASILTGIEVSGLARQVIHLELPNAVLRGRVRADVELDEAHVLAVPVLEGEADQARRLLDSAKMNRLVGCRPDKDGRFELRNLSPGKHELQLRIGAEVLARRRVDVQHGTADIGVWLLD